MRRKSLTMSLGSNNGKQISLEAVMRPSRGCDVWCDDVTYPECDHDDALLWTGGVSGETRIFIPSPPSYEHLTRPGDANVLLTRVWAHSAGSGRALASEHRVQLQLGDTWAPPLIPTLPPSVASHIPGFWLVTAPCYRPLIGQWGVTRPVSNVCTLWWSYGTQLGL